MRRDKRLFIWAIVIIALSLLISGYSLYSQSIRLDEAQSIWAATKSVKAIIEYIATDVHVPLYEIILHFWIQIFGTSVVAVRTPSMIFFILTLPILYKLARESSTDKVAILTVILFSLSPFIMWYSTEARMYTLFAFVTSLNSLFFLRMLRSEGQKGKTGYFISTLIGFYTHYFFIFLILSQGVFCLGRLILQVKSDESSHSFLAKVKEHILFQKDWFLLTFLAGLFLVPWLIYFFSLGAGANTQPLIPTPTTYNIFQTFVVFLFGFQNSLFQSSLVSLWPLAVVILFFVFTQKRRIQAESIEYFVMTTFLPILIVFGVSYIKPVFLSRYLIFVTPTLFFLIAWILLNYSRKTSTYLIAAVTVLMLGLLIYQDISASTPVREDYRGVDQYLASNARVEDIVAVSAPFTVYPIEYYYTSLARMTTIPEWDRYTQTTIPRFSLPDLEKQVDAYKQSYSNIFLVLSYDQGYQKDIQDYMDHHYKLEVVKNFSPGLQVREYKLRYS